jgi:uncharacterized protein with GYD domain
MATYITLIKFTPQGLRDIQDSPKRAADFSDKAKKAGITVKDVYWLIGAYDGVILFEAENEEAAASAMLKLGAYGNVTTETLRAFNTSQMTQVIANATA